MTLVMITKGIGYFCHDLNCNNYFGQQNGGQGLNDDDFDVDCFYNDKYDDNLTGEIVSKAGREEIPFSDN